MVTIFKDVSAEAVMDIINAMKENDTAIISVSGRDREGGRAFNVNMNLGFEDTSKLFGQGIIEME